MLLTVCFTLVLSFRFLCPLRYKPLNQLIVQWTSIPTIRKRMHFVEQRSFPSSSLETFRILFPTSRHCDEWPGSRLKKYRFDWILTPSLGNRVPVSLQCTLVLFSWSCRNCAKQPLASPLINKKNRGKRWGTIHCSKSQFKRLPPFFVLWYTSYH